MLPPCCSQIYFERYLFLKYSNEFFRSFKFKFMLNLNMAQFASILCDVIFQIINSRLHITSVPENSYIHKIVDQHFHFTRYCIQKNEFQMYVQNYFKRHIVLFFIFMWIFLVYFGECINSHIFTDKYWVFKISVDKIFISASIRNF